MPKRNYTVSEKIKSFDRRYKRRRVTKSKRRPTTSSVKKICQKIIDKNTEFKRYVRLLPATAVTNITNGQILFQGPPIAQGDDTDMRNGDEVQLRKLRFKMVIKSVGASNRLRLVLVKYPQTAGIAGNLGDVLENVTAQNVMISPWLKNGDIKYQILYNKIHNLGTKTVMDGTYKYQNIEFDVKFKKEGESLHFNGPATANPDKNCFILYAVADQALPSPNTNEISCYTTGVYTDL